MKNLSPWSCKKRLKTMMIKLLVGTGTIRHYDSLVVGVKRQSISSLEKRPLRRPKVRHLSETVLLSTKVTSKERTPSFFNFSEWSHLAKKASSTTFPCRIQRTSRKRLSLIHTWRKFSLRKTLANSHKQIAKGPRIVGNLCLLSLNLSTRQGL